MLSSKNVTVSVQIVKRKGKTEEKLFSKWKEADKEKWQGNKTGTRLSIVSFLSDLEKCSELQRWSLSIPWVWQNFHRWTVGCGRNSRTGLMWLDWQLTNLYFLCLLFSQEIEMVFVRTVPFCFVSLSCVWIFADVTWLFYSQSHFWKRLCSFNWISTIPFLGGILNSITVFTGL